MTMSSATLSTQLQAMSLYSDEASAITAWADAFATYFLDAVTALHMIPVIAAAVTGTAKPAMAAAMTGLSTDGAAAIVAGITAFWVPINTTPATFFAGCVVPSSPPAGLATLEAALNAVFASNISGELSKADCMDAIAGVIHSGNAGGTVTVFGFPPMLEAVI